MTTYSPNNGSGFTSQLPKHASSRFPAPHELEHRIIAPHCPRANIAADAEHPNGTTEHGWAKEHSDKSVLEQHVLFFDPDSDGIIWPLDTLKAHLKLGFNPVFAVLALLIIHGGLAYWTQTSWIPDPFFRIHVDNIHRAKHGSDSGVYDPEGRFNVAAFESLFSKFDVDQKGGLTWREGGQLIMQHRTTADLFGWFAAAFEWSTVYILFSPANKVITKDQIRKVFDGSVFYDIDRKRVTRQKGLQVDQNNVKHD